MASSSCRRKKTTDAWDDACSHTYANVRVPRGALTKCHTRARSRARARAHTSLGAFHQPLSAIRRLAWNLTSQLRMTTGIRTNSLLKHAR